MLPRQPILDASVLLNLYASGRLGQISHAIGYAFAVADYVLAEEALYVWSMDTGHGERQKVLLETRTLILDGVLETLTLRAGAEEATFLDLAARMDDGEAITGALAIHRELAIATDDRKARRVLRRYRPQIPLHSTLELIKVWSESEGIGTAEARAALLAIWEGARYYPGPADPLFEWWRGIIASES